MANRRWKSIRITSPYVRCVRAPVARVFASDSIESNGRLVCMCQWNTMIALLCVVLVLLPHKHALESIFSFFPSFGFGERKSKNVKINEFRYFHFGQNDLINRNCWIHFIRCVIGGKREGVWEKGDELRINQFIFILIMNWWVAKLWATTATKRKHK